MAPIFTRFCFLLIILFYTVPPTDAKTEAELAAPVSIISKDDVEKTSSSRNISDMINLKPGVTADHANASDSQPPILRDRTYTNYLMVDGVRVNPDNYAGIDPSLIKSIEVVKSPASSIYGKDAIAGVINFITSDDGDYSSGLSFTSTFKLWNKGGGMTQIDPPSTGEDMSGFSIFGKSKTGLEYGMRVDPVYTYDYGAASGSSSTDILSNFRKRPRCTHMALPRYGQFLSSESFGQAAGISGPIITYGELNRIPTLGIYDASGVPVGFLNKDLIKSDPTLTQQMIQFAGERSLVYQRDYLRDWSGGLTYNLSDDLKYRPSPWGHTLNEYGRYNPTSVFMPQLGMGNGDLSTLSGGVNYEILNNGFGKLFSDQSGPRCGPSAFNEEIFLRETLKKSAVPVDPNDPLYLDERHEKKAKSKKNNEPIILGSQMKMFGVIVGAVSAEDRKGINPDADVVDQWGLRAVGFFPKSDPASAWNIIDGSQKNVTVAIIDSGLDLEHPDGPQYIWTNSGEIPDNGIDDDNDGYVDDAHGWNFLENNNDLRDFYGHGTNVTGIIAAKANNGIGIAGINPGAEIMSLKVVGSDGYANSLNIYRALRYAADHGAKVINISLGDKGVSKLEQLGINYAYGKGAFIVIAAGNKNEYIPGNGPASAKHVFTVGAQNYEGTRSTISSWGPNLALIAPAEQIYTLFSKEAKWTGASATKDRAYIRVSGTSFSAPIVSATASLLLAKNPDLTSAQLRDVLLQTAFPIEKEKDSWNGMTGAGSLNAAAALKAGTPSGLIVQLTGLTPNEDKKKISSMDIFGTVSGDVESFVVEIGKGKHASKFKQVAGPYTQKADNNWLCRVDGKQLKGSDEWTMRITAKDKSGQTKTAQAFITFP